MDLKRVFIFGILLLVLSGVAEAGVISDAPSFASILMKMLTFVLSAAGIIAILALVVSGLMYMSAAGDASGVATAKKYALASVIGMSVALAALIIVKQIVRLL